MLTIAAIQRTVAAYYKVPLETMRGRSHLAKHAQPRQVAMFLCRALADSKHPLRASYPNIGHYFGDRHYTTVMHACRAVKRRAHRDREVRRDVLALARKVSE